MMTYVKFDVDGPEKCFLAYQWLNNFDGTILDHAKEEGTIAQMLDPQAGP